MVSVSQSTPRAFYFNPMLSCLSQAPSACPQPVLFLQGSLSAGTQRHSCQGCTLGCHTARPGSFSGFPSPGIPESSEGSGLWGLWGGGDDSLSTQPWDSFRSRTQSRQCSGLTTGTVPNPRTHCSRSP